MAQKLFQLPLLGIALFCLLVGAYLFTNKRFSKKKPSDPVAKHPVDKSSADTLKYWTADKMRNAQPVSLPTTDKIKREKQGSDHSDLPNS